MLVVAVSNSQRTLSSESRPAATSSASDVTAAGAADTFPDPRNQRVLHAAVAGLPNAGKSTLLNYMVGDKVRLYLGNLSALPSAVLLFVQQ